MHKCMHIYQVIYLNYFVYFSYMKRGFLNRQQGSIRYSCSTAEKYDQEVLTDHITNAEIMEI